MDSLLKKQKNILRYWRASIKNKQFLDFKVSEIQYYECQIQDSLLQDGQINIERTNELFEKNKNLLKKVKKYIQLIEEDKVEEEEILPIIIAPFIYTRKHEQGNYKHTEKRSFVHPVWIYAYLDSGGNIFNFYPCSIPPWISREYLNPVYKNDILLTIGEMSDYDNFLDKKSLNNSYISSEDEQTIKDGRIYWKNLHQYSVDMLEKVCPNLAKLIEDSGYFKSDKMLLIPTDENLTKSYYKNLLKLLDGLESENEKYSPLLSRYLNLNSSDEKPPLSIIEQLKSCASQHFGQISDIFPLAKSQRIALHHLLLMQQEGEILAINGPPGTGKTTLIQSIIASLWSKAAIDDKSPPIIVVSSTNNKAIYNVLDNFSMAQMAQKENALSKRWINNLSSFGLCLANEKKHEEKKYQYCRSTKGVLSGALQELENANMKQMKKYFLENFNSYFNLDTESVTEAKSILHKKILELHKSLTSGLQYALSYKEILDRHPERANDEFLNLKLTCFQNKLIFYEQEIEKLNSLEIEWRKIKDKASWQIMSLLYRFLPNFLKQFQINRIELFLLEKKLPIKADEILIDHYIKRKRSQYYSLRKKLNTLTNMCSRRLEVLNSAREKWETWKKEQQAEHLDIANIYTFDITSEEKNHILEFLDTKIRYLLFQYSVHYWEASWLIDVAKIHKKREKDGTDKNAKIKIYQRMAMLTPCFVTTMLSGPGFFTCKMTEDQDSEFMKNSIDLLIIDEAGQVDPSFAAGMIALSKRACVIGDNFQLPPIQSIGGAIDIGNLKHYKIISENEEYFNLCKLGITLTGNSKNTLGSVMKIAQNTCLFQEPIAADELNERGLFLTEHRRCVPEIISYCNDYFYKNKMTYHRPSNKNKDCPYPAFGYAHIPGVHETAAGSSKINKIEAYSIVNWIVKQEEVFKKLYPHLKFHQIFGIITPFHAQAALLRDLLKKVSNDWCNNNVGTVHTFQGGEFPIIIFSPVYSYENNQKNYFFDSEENMLNVAVSRAKDHFFVFGDIDIFDADRKEKIPSKLLAEYLFTKEENELTDVYIIRKAQYKKLTIEHINSLEGHRGILNKAFHTAKKRIVCVSPWIRRKALESDSIETLIRQASARKVSVIIYTDFSNNFKNNTPQDRDIILKCLNHLQNAGAEIRVVHNIHAKTLIVDNECLVEGSFNWLSSSRDILNYEASICSTGIEIEKLIGNVIQSLKERLPMKVAGIQDNTKHNQNEVLKSEKNEITLGYDVH